MALRGTRRAAIVLCALALCSPAARGWEPTSLKRPVLELPPEKTERRVLKELLGRDRWRRLDQARFKIELHEKGLTRPLVDDRTQHEEVADVLLASLGRIAHKGLLRTLRLEERRDAFRARLKESRRGDSPAGGGSGPKLRFSPRFRFDGDAWVGAKFRLTGTRSGFLSNTSLRLGTEVDGHNPGVKFAFENDTRRVFLIYHGDHRKRGESIELLIGFSF